MTTLREVMRDPEMVLECDGCKWRFLAREGYVKATEVRDAHIWLCPKCWHTFDKHFMKRGQMAIDRAWEENRKRPEY
jgi:uncharacterized C2H2 Zn-finger protein